MEINEYLVKSFEVIGSMENVDFFAGVNNLSRTEFRKGKNIISSELARRLGITRSAVSQIVTKMEQRGIVNRVASPTDRKIAYVCLSERALAVFEEQCKEANATMQCIVERYGEENVKELFARFNEFRKIAEEVMEEREESKERSGD